MIGVKVWSVMMRDGEDALLSLSLHFTKMGLTADQLIYGVIRVAQ